MDLKDVKNRHDLEKFASQKGYNTANGRIPIDFYKKEINLVNFAKDALNYTIDTSKVGRYQENQKWFYLNRKGMKDEALEDPLYASSKIVVGRKSVSPGSNHFKYNGHYYFTQELAHAGDKHGSIIDLVQMHYGTDFRGALKVIDNFLIHNKILKENFNNTHIAQSTTDGKSIARRLTEYHNIKPFDNPQFLNERGISNETIQDPRFQPLMRNQISVKENEFGAKFTHVNTAFMIVGKQGLIGFEVRNHAFKGVLDQKQDGFVRSVIDNSKPVEKILVSESFIDTLSKVQLDKDKSNSVFMSTAGNISGRQIELLQNMLDKGVSVKAEFTHQLPPEMYNNVIHTKNYIDHKGVTQKNEKGEPITISYVGHNQPQKLTLAFDNDQAGKMLTIKTLGRLKAGEYFGQDNSALANSEISVYSNKIKNEGRITWRMGEADKDTTVKAMNTIIDRFNDLNKNLAGKLDEQQPYALTNEGNDITARFRHSNTHWDHVVNAVKQIKFNNSQKLEIAKPITKDFNQDLKGRLGIDKTAQRKLEVYELANKVTSIKEQKILNNQPKALKL